MTIGNLSSTIHHVLSNECTILVTFLRIPIKNCNIPQLQVAEQWQTNWEVVNKVIPRVLKPLSFTQTPSAESQYYKVLCAHGNLRRCKPVFAVWLPNCPDYCNLYHLERHVYFWSECPKNELGCYVSPNN